MWVLYGSFLVLESLCYGVLGPNMWRFSTMVRDGSLDLALTRPVSTQFLVSLRYIDPNGVLNSLVGVALMFTGFWRLNQWPNLLDWLLWFVLFVCAFIIAYAIWFMCVTIGIWAVKTEGISVVFDPMLQIARFPVQVYPQRMQWILLTILPAAFLTTFPAQALLGRSPTGVLLPAIAFAAFLLFCSHRFFNFALKYYGSASS